MAGLEVVVRPVVFPNIRPAPARSLPPADDPDKGFALIRGNGAKQIDLSNSYSSSVTAGTVKEIKRRVDVARVYQKDDSNKINRKNFVDVEVANKLWMQGAAEPTSPKGDKFADVSTRLPRVEIQTYRRVQEQDNIEIKKRDVIKKSDDQNPS